MVNERSSKARRNTRQRTVVLEEVKQTTSHPTAMEVYEAARRRLPRISLGTVYRNLERLEEQGFIRKLDTGGGEARFDGDVEPHHHVRCVGCGVVGDVPGVAADAWPGGLPSVQGYEIVGYRLELAGVCSDCRQRSAGQSEGVFAGRRS